MYSPHLLTHRYHTAVIALQSQIERPVSIVALRTWVCPELEKTAPSTAGICNAMCSAGWISRQGAWRGMSVMRNIGGGSEIAGEVRYMDG